MEFKVQSAVVAGELETDLEGRLEVMLDDRLADTPDYQDADACARLLRDIKTFPATLELSSAEHAQMMIAVENVLDFTDTAEVIEALGGRKKFCQHRDDGRGRCIDCGEFIGE